MPARTDAMASVPPVDAPIAITWRSRAAGAAGIGGPVIAGSAGAATGIRRRAEAAARILAARVRRSSPTEYGPPGFARTSTAPSSRASNAARQEGCANELITTVGSGWKRISFFRKVSPSILGISMSRVSTSGRSARILSRAT